MTTTQPAQETEAQARGLTLWPATTLVTGTIINSPVASITGQRCCNP